MKLTTIACSYLLLFFFINSYSIDEIPRGEVVDTIKCIYDKQQSYALYLPSYYTTDKKYPIIYIFEPAARGVLPVKKYHSLAEKYGYILVCSNNSRNGPLVPSEKAADAIMADTKIRFTINKNRIYTMGFSGGARMATRLAIENKNIKAVIACGAGFPDEIKPRNTMGFTFIGLVGDLDMNYREIKKLENKLIEERIAHGLFYFSGDHIWPPENEMDKAFCYLQFDAMKRGLLEIDTNYIKNFKAQAINTIDSIKDVYKYYQNYKRLYNQIKDLTITTDIETKINDLSNNPVVKEAIQKEKINLTKESEIADEISKAFFDPTNYGLAWWKTKTLKFYKIVENSSDEGDILVAKRLINKIYLMVSEKYWLNGKESSLEEKERLLKIASLAKPDNWYPNYNLAAEYAKNNKIGPACKMLQNAIEKGFSNLDYIKKDPDFEKIRDKKKFIEIIQQIKQ